MTIGERAAQEIRKMVQKKRIKLSDELSRLTMNRKTLGDWEKRNINPSGYWLQQLANAGYDVNWILTGKVGFITANPDYDTAEYEEENE